MEQSMFILAATIAIFYLIGKIIEQKFILKEEIILKNIVKDTFLVYGSVIVGSFILTQVQDINNGKSPVSAFTGEPDF